MNQKSRKLTVLAISGLPLWNMGEKKGMPSLYEGVKAFIRHGHNVHFITCFPPLHGSEVEVDHSKEYIKEGIRIYQFSIPLLSALKRLKNRTFSPHPLIQLFQYAIHLFSEYTIWILFTIGAVFKAKRVSSKYHPDVIYAYNEFAALAGYIVAKMYKVPNITRLFGTFLYYVLSSVGFWLRYAVAISGYVIPSAYLIVANDGTKGNKVAEALGINKKRLRFWRNGVDLSIYDPDLDVETVKRKLGISKNVKIILSLCRLERWKGVHKLIEIIPQIVSKEKNVLFIIVGDGSQKPDLEKMVKKLKISKWVHFRGSANREQVKEFLNIADIFVTLQDLSNLSNVFLEAFTCGKCIVTINDGSTEELLKNGHSGVLVNPNNIKKELPEVLLDLIKNESKRKQMGENARRIALKKLQSWEERGDMEVRLIENLISSKYKNMRDK